MESSDQLSRQDLRLHAALRRIIQAFDIESRHLMAELGITATQLNCLAAIATTRDITAQAVAREIHVGSSTLVGVIDRLEEKGLVLRMRDTVDRRRILLRATPAGKRLLRRAPSALGRTAQAGFNELPETQRAELVSAAEQIASLLEAGHGPVRPS